MKVSKLMTIDHEIAERLKTENASQLVNSLLIDHFSESHDFKRIRIMSRLKILKQQQADIDREKHDLSEEVKKFTNYKNPKKEITEHNKVKITLHQGEIQKEELKHGRI